jgi:hypothetical protein
VSVSLNTSTRRYWSPGTGEDRGYRGTGIQVLE